MRRTIRLALACAVFGAVAAAAPAYADGVGVTLLSNNTYGAGIQYSDVYYHDGMAFIGTWTTPGRVFIADPATGALIGTHATSNNSLVRDMQAQGRYLYVALDAAGIDIVDISNPASPSLVLRYNTSAVGVHDLFIHGNTLYYVDDVSGSRLHIVDVTNPAAPANLTTFLNPGGCHDLTVVGNRAYLANLGGGFQILDVTNPAAPVSLGTKNYSGSFTHNIWPSPDGRYAATTDETCGTGHLRIWDISNPAAVFQVSEYTVPNQGDTCVHNAMWMDNYIYLSYYLHGLRILDATNPLAPVEVAYYETHAHPREGAAPRHDELGGCFDGAWGIYAERSGPTSARVYISDIGSGLWEFSFDTAPNLATDGVAVFDAPTGTFFLRDATAPGAADAAFNFGAGGAVVGLSGDWDGNGTKTIGVYDPATSTFFLKNTNAPGAADVVVSFGAAGAGLVPVVGDWDGNDTETVGVYNPSTGTFFLRTSNTPGTADLAFAYGPGGSAVPVVGDWDDTDNDTVGVYVPATGTFFLKNANAPGAADVVFSFGTGGNAVPVVGNWDGVGSDSVGIYNPSTATFFVTNANAPGAADLAFAYGPAGLAPLSGDWRGPGF